MAIKVIQEEQAEAFQTLSELTNVDGFVQLADCEERYNKIRNDSLQVIIDLMDLERIEVEVLSIKLAHYYFERMQELRREL